MKIYVQSTDSRKATDSSCLTDLHLAFTVLEFSERFAPSLERQGYEYIQSHGQLDRSIEPGAGCSVSQVFSWPSFLLSLVFLFPVDVQVDASLHILSVVSSRERDQHLRMSTKEIRVMSTVFHNSP